MWNTIVIGSGISGLTAAAALARCGQRVLVLEQHRQAGGLTQTFTRKDWTFATGVHYISGVGPRRGPEGQFGRVLQWLSADALHFADCGNPYDIVRLPGFEFAIEHPRTAYRQALQQRFPKEALAIDDWFAEIDASCHAAHALLASRGLPPLLAWGLRLWNSADVRHFSQRTIAEALEPIADLRLRAVLGARWGNYGAAPDSAPLLEHALVTAAYDGGAYYPVGGPGRFAQTLQPVIEAAGGEVRLGADVQQIVAQGGRAGGVRYRQGRTWHTETSASVISAMGIGNTVACLDAEVAPRWQETVSALRPGPAYLALYIGFDGDIAAAGATAANVWIYESEQFEGVWQAGAGRDAPALFVSFPSLKDPARAGKHTAEVIALCDAQLFAPWLHLPEGKRPADYLALKARLQARLLAQFQRHFPALAAQIAFHEMSTPVTHQRYVRSPEGAMYGIEMSAERLASTALNVRTPMPGLLLAGQDISGAGIQASCLSGIMTAAVLEPSLLQKLAL